MKVYLTIVDCNPHDGLEVLDLLDAAVSPDGLMNANLWAFLET